MVDTFAELAGRRSGNSDDERVRAGDPCPKECERELFELTHDFEPQNGCEPHDSYRRVEVVCVHHGIVRALR
jgi:hypothetical protein